MNERNAFKGSLGFVLAAAGSAVGLGNIWRFPYLAAKDGGGIFLLVYFVLLLTFGFALLTTEIAIGRKTKQGPLTAYGYISEKWKHLGILGCLIPAIILPYYCAIGGWVLKYFMIYVNGEVLWRLLMVSSAVSSLAVLIQSTTWQYSSLCVLLLFWAV